MIWRVALALCLGAGMAFAQAVDLNQGGPIQVPARDAMSWSQMDQFVNPSVVARAVPGGGGVEGDGGDRVGLGELGKRGMGRARWDPRHAAFGRLETWVECKELAGVECQGGVRGCACVHATRIAPSVRMQRVCACI